MKTFALLMVTVATLTGCTVPPAPTPTPSIIEEDDPRFDCTIHGNRVCGSDQEA